MTTWWAVFTLGTSLINLCALLDSQDHAGMRPIDEVKARWEVTLANSTTVADLRAAVKATNGRNPCAIFLLFKETNKSTWRKTLSDSRGAYASLREHFLKNIEHPDNLSADDPLTGTDTSPWDTLRLDEQLRAEIFQDVERCMPENLYFREPSTQNMLLDILFIYCKLNRDIGYRQGMHEVLAPIIWVISRDAIDPVSLYTNYSDLDDMAISNLDHSFIEHDAFTIFGAIMQNVKAFYEMGSNTDPNTLGLLNNSPIVERSKRIHENYLHHADPELAEHLTAIEILPQIFLIRWVRLLFGREFPFEDVLALWDVLFAEDPGLDLVDLISVSMLLRIRWQLLEADYTAALTLLLRYPVPSPPHGPSSFVSDALYLRDNLLLDGGDHIISKYSRRAPETTVTRKLPKKLKKARTADQTAAQKAASPTLTPAKFFQDQGGIEGIIHEAAKGVYHQGEKWGVGKALRGAVQGLQSSNTSPRPAHRSRWSLDTGKVVSDKPPDMVAKIESLEQRNRSLAKLLENAVNELWVQQKDIRQKEEKHGDALSLAIAKVQFVQVYLENSSMQLPTEGAPAEGVEDEQSETTTKDVTIDQAPQRTHPAQNDGSAEAVRASNPNVGRALPSPGPIAATMSAAPLPSTPKIGSPLRPPSSPPSQQPRPTLAQSPFSWMLGEEQQKSNFVPASPFQQDKRDSSGKAGSLFGEARKPGNADAAEEDEDVFTSRTLKGGRRS